MTLANAYGYPEAVWLRFTTAAHAGGFADGEENVLTAEAGSPAAKSLLRLQVKLERGRVAAARFRAYGCPVAIAVGEWLAQQAEGHPLAELARLDAAAIRAALEIADDKAHCAFMGEDVIRQVMKMKQT